MLGFRVEYVFFVKFLRNGRGAEPDPPYTPFDPSRHKACAWMDQPVRLLGSRSIDCKSFLASARAERSSVRLIDRL